VVLILVIRIWRLVFMQYRFVFTKFKMLVESTTGRITALEVRPPK